MTDLFEWADAAESARMKRWGGGAMSPEESARRMTALLARPPRSSKTRAYLKSLPPRPAVVVKPDDYQIPAPEAPAPPPAPVAEPAARKDRRRPKARPAPPPPPPPPPPSRWACRPAGNRNQPWRGGPREPRTKEEAEARRLLLGEAQAWICALCGGGMDRHGKASEDHVIPHALGGAGVLGNLILCHHVCNSRKSNDIPTGCEMIWLFAVNARLGLHPQRY